ncbi:hypothetical protein DZG00_03670 [Clavibacter lycopersici]|uniref:Uncharacterized protein n=1 Tax=Clavibacter lycopersici TaxID=2301718 RepID=A0A399TCJ8_9MICO|nr:hypothetical protein [Clavibacter lycopersici]RIJ52724.1 hypothetical protein DZG00_03670 [Clavibacter lycopersici]RIJ59975.1 hypothetical protein DZG02_10845 [Clavibacter lycopersici]
MDPVRRLMFWLRVPFVADAALVVIGIALLVGGDGVGWWVLVFAGLRAVVGVVAIVWIAPRMIARLATPAAGTDPAADTAPDPDPPRSPEPPVARLDP